MGGTILNRWAVSEKDHDGDVSEMHAIGEYCLKACDSLSREGKILWLHEDNVSNRIVAHAMGRKVSSSQELIEFLQQVPANKLLKYTSRTEMIPKEGEPRAIFMQWNLVIESKRNFPGQRQTHVSLLKNDDYPFQ